jgi:hypothetical protein
MYVDRGKRNQSSASGQARKEVTVLSIREPQGVGPQSFFASPLSMLG